MSEATAARFLPYPENQCQWSRNHFWSFTFGDQGIPRIYKITTVPLTALVLQNTEHNRQNIDSRITDVATQKMIKNEFLDVNHLPDFDQIQLSNSKACALYTSTDVPAGRPADPPTNSDGWGDVH